MSVDITESDAFEIRYTHSMDLQALTVLLDQQRSWFPISTDRQREFFARNWIYMGKAKASLTLLYQGQIVGFVALFLMPYKKTKHLCQGYIVVDEAYRNQGVEARAVKNLDHLAKTGFSLKKLFFKEFDGCYLTPFLQEAGYHLLYKQTDYVEIEPGRYADRGVYEKAFSEEVMA